jgi:glutaredoxin
MGICCGSQEKSRIINEIKADIYSLPIVVYSKAGCPKCLRIKSKLFSVRAEPKIIEVRQYYMKNILREVSGKKTFPFVSLWGKFMETREIEAEISKGSLDGLKKGSSQNFKT